MTVRIAKQPVNIREKLSELERPIGLKGSELMRSETAQEARELVGAGRKNLIINGAMEVAQRGTSVTGKTDSAAYLTVDRFANHSSGATYDSSQEEVTNGGMSGLPIKFKKYFKFSVTTGANNAGIWQTIENVRTVQGEHTFSFYARGVNPAGGVLEVDSRQWFNGSAEVDTLLGTFRLTDTWQRFTFTFTPPSLSGKTIGSNSYYRLFIRQPNADNSTNAWHIDTTGWQLEVGKNATEFEHRSYGEELALCQRYYYEYPKGNTYNIIANGLANTTTNALFHFQYPVPMRSAPVVATSGNWQVIDGQSHNVSGFSAITAATQLTGRVDVTTSGLTEGRACMLRNNNDATARFGFNAEL